MEFGAAGIHPATRSPPARIEADGRVALYRAVTNACRHSQRFPPRPGGPARLFRPSRPVLHAQVAARAAQRINTANRALITVSFVRRAALLLPDLSPLSPRSP